MLWERWGMGCYNLVLIQERLQEKPMFATNITAVEVMMVVVVVVKVAAAAVLVVVFNAI
jgi:hypothetical protein